MYLNKLNKTKQNKTKLIVRTLAFKKPINYDRFESLYVIWVSLSVQCLKVVMTIGIIAFDLGSVSCPH